MWTEFSQLLLPATWQTIYMVLSASFISLLLGLPLGVLLLVTDDQQIVARPVLHKLLNSIVNITRSIPFIILLVAVVPLTRLLTGTSIGTAAAIVPLSLSAIPFLARLIETALREIPPGLLETGQALGASSWQIISKILLPEVLPGLIQSITVTMINLVGYSAMAGAVGGGGLGSVAINYGYQRFDTTIMLETVVILIILVHIIQYLGNYLAKKCDHRS